MIWHGRPKGFTLIELLIVIAIILILIAIALPNFLEAQLRARITKAKGDLRTLGTAFDEYYLDWGLYPPDHDPDEFGSQSLHQLTSPIKYLSSIPEDPFVTRSGLADPRSEIGWEIASTGVKPGAAAFGLTSEGNSRIYAYNITSHGPDMSDSFGCNDGWPLCGRTPCPGSAGGWGDGWMTYAPTNGSKSLGDLTQLGGEHRSGSYCIDGWNHIRGYDPRLRPR